MSAILIEIKAKWVDSGEEFTDNAAIGQYDGESDDDHIFYWFDSSDMVIGEHEDFIVISYSVCHKWINKNTEEEYEGDTLGTISVSYDEHKDETSFYLGGLNISVLMISGELDDEEVAQYIQDYLSEWEAKEQVA